MWCGVYILYSTIMADALEWEGRMGSGEGQIRVYWHHWVLPVRNIHFDVWIINRFLFIQSTLNTLYFAFDPISVLYILTYLLYLKNRNRYQHVLGTKMFIMAKFIFNFNTIMGLKINAFRVIKEKPHLMRRPSWKLAAILDFQLDTLLFLESTS